MGVGVGVKLNDRRLARQWSQRGVVDEGRMFPHNQALPSRHILFLCVANSARSQMAEGIARRLAPEGVRVTSAGSMPTTVRSQAVEVLREIGIDISRQTSKGVEAVERPVDVVITLCAEEVCPLWLGDAERLHWALPDPAAVQGTEEQKLEAFRGIRDELSRRLGVFFGG
jgi:arsenate reductase